MTAIVAADIGGTHARFALAQVDDGRVLSLGEAVTLRTADFVSLPAAWAEFGRIVGQPLPAALAIAVAGPVNGDLFKLTNNSWVIHPDTLDAALRIDRHLLVNDFGAVAHAVAHLPPADFAHVCGPNTPLPATGVISIVGPGTGLGVAALHRRSDDYDVIATEGGHIDFAPLDEIEDRILGALRRDLRRVSVERLVAGGGIANIYRALAGIEQRPVLPLDDRALWKAALDGEDALAVAALDRYFLILGAVTGDLALAQGAKAVVLAGGLGQRLKNALPGSGFASRFTAKGRFERRMEMLPVKVVTHPQPGLYGAAAAFARLA